MTKALKICYVSGVKLCVEFFPLGANFTSDPLNYFWEVREATGLASMGHNIYWASPTSPLRVGNVDIVFCAADRMSSEAINIGHNFKVPVVLQMISRPADYPDQTWDRIKEAMRESQAITCVSPVVFRGVKEWAGQNDYKGIIELVPHGVDTELVDTVPPGERRQFLYIGALMGHKRVDWLIRAAARTGLPLNIIGDGPEASKLIALAKLYSSPVTFLGPVNEPGKFMQLKAARALLTASIGEQFWIPGAEALSCSTRVICNHLQDVIDTYGDSLSYFTNFDELCSLMRDLWDNTDAFDGRAWIEKLGLSLKARSKKLVDVLRRCLG